MFQKLQPLGRALKQNLSSQDTGRQKNKMNVTLTAALNTPIATPRICKKWLATTILTN